MKGIWVITIASILILGIFGILQHAQAATVIISDQASCEAQGGTFSTNKCFFSNLTILAGDTWTSTLLLAVANLTVEGELNAPNTLDADQLINRGTITTNELISIGPSNSWLNDCDGTINLLTNGFINFNAFGTNHGTINGDATTSITTPLTSINLVNSGTIAPNIVLNKVTLQPVPSPCPTGATGPTGPTGPTGAQGAAGPSGIQGAAGPSGAQGAGGASGPAGVEGAAGPSGVQGAPGPPGVQGAQGVQGSTGPLGPTGATGPAGPTGPAGATGATGTGGFTTQTCGSGKFMIGINADGTIVCRFILVPGDDFGGDALTAELLPVGVAIDGAINFVGDEDWFSFRIDSTKTIRMETAIASPPMDTFLTLIAPDGITVIDTNDDFGGGVASRIERTLTAGTYFVVVRHFDISASSGGYTLTISDIVVVPPGDDFGGDASTAESFPPITSAGVTIAGTINFAGDEDWFRFTIDSTKTIRMETALTSPGMDTVLTLITANGISVLDTNDDFGGGAASRIERTLTAAPYFVVVRHFQGSVSGESYTLTITDITP